MKQNTPEWLEMRKKFVGASDAPIIMGVSPWMTPYKLGRQKLSLDPEVKKTTRMQRGLALEDAARQWFYKETGILVLPEVVFSDEHDFMMASLDGLDSTKECALEIKCPDPEGDDHALALMGMVPEKYYPQLQHQMIVLKLEKMFYLSFDGKEGALIEVQRDNEYIAILITKEKEFYEWIRNQTLPPLTEKDYLQREDQEWINVVEEYNSVYNSLKALEEKEKDLKEKLIKLAGSSNAKGHGLSVFRTFRKGNIDYNQIPELQSINLESYRKKPTEFWTVRKA